MAISAVKCALETVKAPPTNVEALDAERKRLAAFFGSLLPVERGAYTETEQRLKHVTEQLAQAKLSSEFGGLSQLDLRVLSWTKQQKMPFHVLGVRPRLKVPAFAYLPVLHIRAELSASWGSANFPHGVPEPVGREVQKAMRPLGHATGLPFFPDTIGLTYRFPGVIPDQIRQTIENETRFTREELAFVCEVDEWEIRSHRAPRFSDPILVGFKEGAMWVLDSFDPTPTETYLLNEFTS